MPRVGDGWVYTTHADSINDFWIPTIPLRDNKVQHLTSLNKSSDTPLTPIKKQWTDQSLLSNEHIQRYFAQSNALQQTYFTNIMKKWNEHERNRTNRLLSLFDTHYGMEIRFRRNNQLNRSSDRSYASIARYYRLLSNERNLKNNQPCVRHQRRTQEYDERHLCQLFKLSTTIRTRHPSNSPSDLTKLPPIKMTIQR